MAGIMVSFKFKVGPAAGVAALCTARRSAPTERALWKWKLCPHSAPGAAVALAMQAQLARAAVLVSANGPSPAGPRPDSGSVAGSEHEPALL